MPFISRIFSARMQQWRAHQHRLPSAVTSKPTHILTCIARTIESPRFCLHALFITKLHPYNLSIEI